MYPILVKMYEFTDFKKECLIMRKPLRIFAAIVIVLAVVVGAVFVFGSLLSFEPENYDTAVAYTLSDAPDADAGEEELIGYARDVLQVLYERDYAALAAFVHPENGILFSAYATVSPDTDCTFSPDEVVKFASDNTKYIWGMYDGIGEPIELTPAEYFDRFVFDVDFTKCENFGINEVLRVGNALENIGEAFPDGVYVDCHLPDPYEEGGPDWHSLRLVFEEYDGKLMLTAIVHNEFTV